jgi:hypothetical protein
LKVIPTTWEVFEGQPGALEGHTDYLVVLRGHPGALEGHTDYLVVFEGHTDYLGGL